jgi:hypothetical protein
VNPTTSVNINTAPPIPQQPEARSLFPSFGPNSSQSKTKYNQIISTNKDPGKF